MNEELEPIQEEVKTPSIATSAEQVAAQLTAFNGTSVTTGTVVGEEILPDVVFDRLSVERRVLGHITDEIDSSALGPRNTLAAITHALMTDDNTTYPPAGRPRLNIDGETIVEIAQSVLNYLETLKGAGLVEQLEDGSYKLTDAGHTELAS